MHAFLRGALWALLALCGLVQEGWAQDPAFSQFYVSPAYINPASAGTVPHYRLASVYRNQWPNIPGAYETNLLAFEYNWDYLNSGVAILVANDRAKEFGYHSTSLGISYAYQAKLSKKQFLRFGLQGGYLLRSYGFNRLTFADGLKNGGGSSENLGLVNQGFPDFAAGALYYTEGFWAGLSMLHFTYPKLKWKPNTALYSDFLYPQLNLQVGGKISFKKGKWEVGYLQPSAMLQWQQGLGQVIAGANFAHYPMVVGLWYKGMPFGPQSGLTSSGLTALAGYRHNSIGIHYSYDWSMGGPLGDFGGAHEISIILSPKSDYRYKGGKKWGNRFVECPIRL